MTPQTRTSSSDHEVEGYVPPISFQELHEAGRLSMPGAEAYEEGYGPIGEATDASQEPTDRLEAFVDAWASAGHTPAEPLLP
ncbi:hypothetical protein [Dermatobacter hominis]|uniref:hypothetical protein n=1 Tax=Dermatobacter hominis TaxID=2884263 RepID=UPI001D0FF6BD|nr:hypothetical protein [Dermatobacter hominis]UDY36908.1 hypothetical protein LH044_05085 [Dermatobacter hominis]